MIVYTNQGWSFLTKILRLKGSVFVSALFVSLPCAALAVLLEWVVTSGHAPRLKQEIAHLGASNATLDGWNSFNVLVGFLVIFRTSQAYYRFWEGCHASYKMGAEWFAACSAVFSFCQHSDCAQDLKLQFQSVLVRLFSMLHAAALGEIEDTRSCGAGRREEDIDAFKFDLIDVQGIDGFSLLAVRDEDSKVELIYQWVQNLIVNGMKNGVLTIPSPILTRIFQELEAGMVACHEAFKISQIPFPFPYAQTCDALLLVHWLLVPFVSCASGDGVWVGIFSFVQVFILWSLDFIAIEIENPFGRDPNDLNTRQMQQEMNRRLCLLMRPYAGYIPKLKHSAINYHQWQDEEVGPWRAIAKASFMDAWGSSPDSKKFSLRFSRLPSQKAGSFYMHEVSSQRSDAAKVERHTSVPMLGVKSVRSMVRTMTKKSSTSNSPSFPPSSFLASLPPNIQGSTLSRPSEEDREERSNSKGSGAHSAPATVRRGPEGGPRMLATKLQAHPGPAADDPPTSLSPRSERSQSCVDPLESGFDLDASHMNVMPMPTDRCGTQRAQTPAYDLPDEARFSYRTPTPDGMARLTTGSTAPRGRDIRRIDSGYSMSSSRPSQYGGGSRSSISNARASVGSCSVNSNSQPSLRSSLRSSLPASSRRTKSLNSRMSGSARSNQGSRLPSAPPPRERGRLLAISSAAIRRGCNGLFSN